MLRKHTLHFKYNQWIKDEKKLPKCISRDRYDGVANLTDKDWYEQLYIRHNCLSALKLINANNQISEEFRKLLKLIRENPIVNISSSKPLKEAYGSLFEYLYQKHNNMFGFERFTAHPTTLHEIYEQAHTIARQKGDAAEKSYAEAFQNFGKIYHAEHKPQDWFFDSTAELLKDSNIAQALFSINLYQPNSIIYPQFAKALASARKLSGIPNPSTKYKTISSKNLVRFNVLPFLDLHIWQVENQIKITNPLIISAIYKDGEGCDDDFKRTKTNALKTLDINRLEHFLQKSALSKNKSK